MKTVLKQSIMWLYNHGHMSGATVQRLFEKYGLQAA